MKRRISLSPRMMRSNYESNVFNQLFIFCVLFVLLFVIGCATAEKKFSQAKNYDTIDSYQSFIKEYPDHPLSAKARMRIDELKSQQAYFAKLKDALRMRAKERLKSGESSPPKVPDTGYQVARVSHFIDGKNQITKDSATFEAGILKYVIYSTEPGSDIIAWRNWYCRGLELPSDVHRTCVFSKWEDGEPTFGGVSTFSYRARPVIKGKVHNVEILPPP